MSTSINDKLPDESQAYQHRTGESLKNLSVLIPDTLDFVVALGTGLAAAQRTETRRLIKKYGDDDVRARNAELRAQSYAKIHTDLARIVTNTCRLTDTVGEANVFHGYVFDDAGQPARGYMVKLNLSANERVVGEFSGIADGDGYFCLALHKDAELICQSREKDPTKLQTRLGARLRDYLAGYADELVGQTKARDTSGVGRVVVDTATGGVASVKAPFDGISKSLDSGVAVEQGSYSSSVTILDTSAKTVYTDPESPIFQASGNGFQGQFRLYAV